MQPTSAALPVGAPRWSVQLSGASSAPTASSLAMAADGGTYLVGSFQGSLSAGATALTGGTSDAVFVAQVTADGKPGWAQRFAATGSARGTAIAIAGDHLIVGGTFSGALTVGDETLTSTAGPDVFVAALKLDGTVLWVRALDGSGTAHVRDLAVTSTGRVVAVGGFDGDLAHGDRVAVAEGMQDAFAVVFEPAGTTGWIRTFGDAGPDSAATVSFLPDGDVVIAGSFFGSVSLADDLASSEDTQDAFVARLRGTTGEPTWSRRFGDTGTEAAHALAVDGAGNIFLAGTFDEPMTIGPDALVAAGNADVFIARLDPAGAPAWARSLGGSGRDFCGQLAVAGTTLAITGAFEQSGSYGNRTLTSDGGLDGFVATYDTSGTGQWAARFGGKAQDDLRGVAVSGVGHITASGAFDGSATLGPTTLTATGARDVIVLRLHP